MIKNTSTKWHLATAVS